MKKLAVVAFGGNALLRAGQKGTIEEQEENAYNASKKLLKLMKRKYNLVLTHGNGPQVGNIMLANDAGHKMYGIPEMPMDVCGAYSQGFIGYILEQQLRNVLMKNDKDRDIITLITISGTMERRRIKNTCFFVRFSMKEPLLPTWQWKIAGSINKNSGHYI